MKEKFLDRLLLFIDQNGGVYEVAKKLELSPQTFYTMKRRGSLPSVSLLYALNEHYSNLDVKWLLFGESDHDLNPEVEKLKEQLKRAEAIIDTLVGIGKTKSA